MTKVTYEVVEHDGGWAYKAQGAFSEPFQSHDDACRAAEHAARGQRVPGEAAGITYQDERGKWHHEVSQGNNRPDTSVEC